MRNTWANVAVLAAMAAAVVVGAARRSPALAHGAGGAGVEQLEAQAAQAPGDRRAAQELARSYVGRGEFGLAVAVFERAPGAADSPAASEVAALAYLNAGQGSASLSMTRRTLELCERQGCEATVVARAARREEMLTAVLEMGVEDVTTHPEAVDLALRRTVRQVRVAMN